MSIGARTEGIERWGAYIGPERKPKTLAGRYSQLLASQDLHSILPSDAYLYLRLRVIKVTLTV